MREEFYRPACWAGASSSKPMPLNFANAEIANGRQREPLAPWAASRSGAPVV